MMMFGRLTAHAVETSASPRMTGKIRRTIVLNAFLFMRFDGGSCTQVTGCCRGEEKPCDASLAWLQSGMHNFRVSMALGLFVFTTSVFGQALPSAEPLAANRLAKQIRDSIVVLTQFGRDDNEEGVEPGLSCPPTD